MSAAGQVAATMRAIYCNRLTTASGGNVSMRGDDGSLWITPKGRDKANVQGRDIAQVDVKGGVRNALLPSSELPFHRAAYAACSDVAAVVHAHPDGLVAWSGSRARLELEPLPFYEHLCGTLGWVPYALPGSEALGDGIAAALAAGHRTIVLENHGVVTAGANLDEAYRRFENAAFAARAMLCAQRSEQDAAAPGMSVRLESRDQSMLAAAIAPPTLPELRTLAARGHRQGLHPIGQGVYASETEAGTAFATAQTDGLLGARATPSAFEQVGQVVLEYLLARTGFASGIFAATPAATGLSTTGLGVDTRVIPETYIVLNSIPTVPLAPVEGLAERLFATLSPSNPVGLVEGAGLVAMGASLANAFDRLEVAESAARIWVEAQALGGIRGVSDDAIRALEEHWLPKHGAAAGAPSRS